MSKVINSWVSRSWKQLDSLDCKRLWKHTSQNCTGIWGHLRTCGAASMAACGSWARQLLVYASARTARWSDKWRMKWCDRCDPNQVYIQYRRRVLRSRGQILGFGYLGFHLIFQVSTHQLNDLNCDHFNLSANLSTFLGSRQKNTFTALVCHAEHDNCGASVSVHELHEPFHIISRSGCWCREPLWHSCPVTASCTYT